MGEGPGGLSVDLGILDFGDDVEEFEDGGGTDRDEGAGCGAFDPDVGIHDEGFDEAGYGEGVAHLGEGSGAASTGEGDRVLLESEEEEFGGGFADFAEEVDEGGLGLFAGIGEGGNEAVEGVGVGVVKGEEGNLLGDDFDEGVGLGGVDSAGGKLRHY